MVAVLGLIAAYINALKPSAVPAAAVPPAHVEPLPLQAHQNLATTGSSLCAEVLRARRDFNLNDGTHQREAKAILERTQRGWPASAQPLDRKLLDVSAEQWKLGDFSASLNSLARAFPCE